MAEIRPAAAGAFAWLPGPMPVRRSGVRRLQENFLIVCEGQRTEPDYFLALCRHLPSVSMGQVEVVGAGRNTISLLEEALRLARGHTPPYDQVWIVFDKDDFPLFNETVWAIASCDAERRLGARWHAAWSNESFEIWYLLHFRGAGRKALPRRRCFGLLTELLGQRYRKNDATLFERLLPYLPAALRRARAGEEAFVRRALAAGQDPEVLDYDAMNPATHVHALVAALLPYCPDLPQADHGESGDDGGDGPRL